MDISLTKLPWYAQVGAFVALAVGGVVAFYYYTRLPARADMVARQSAVESAQSRHHQRARHRQEARRVPRVRSPTSRLVWTISRPSFPKRRTPPICSAACRTWRCSRTSRSGGSSRRAGDPGTPCRVADRARARRDVSQPRDLLRPRG